MRRVNEEGTKHQIRISEFGFRVFLAGWILAVVCVSSAWAVEPANRQSNPQVKAVLEYFYSLSGKTDKPDRLRAVHGFRQRLEPPGSWSGFTRRRASGPR